MRLGRSNDQGRLLMDSHRGQSPHHDPRVSGHVVVEHDDECVYDGVVTIDPEGVLEAWSVLGQDTWAHEFAYMPRIMHHALISTLKERGFIRE